MHTFFIGIELLNLLNGTEYVRLGDLYIVQGANPQCSTICQYICIICIFLDACTGQQG